MAESPHSPKTTSLPSKNDEAGMKGAGNNMPSAQCPGCGGPPNEADEYRQCETCRSWDGKIVSISHLLRLEEVHGQKWNPQMPNYDHALRMKWLLLQQLADKINARQLDGTRLLEEIHAITMPNASRNDFLESTIESVMGLLRTKTQTDSEGDQSSENSKRGRKPKVDDPDEERILEGWKSRSLGTTKKECAEKLGLKSLHGLTPFRRVVRAVDRERKREVKPAKSSRK